LRPTYIDQDQYKAAEVSHNPAAFIIRRNQGLQQNDQINNVTRSGSTRIGVFGRWFDGLISNAAAAREIFAIIGGVTAASIIDCSCLPEWQGTVMSLGTASNGSFTRASAIVVLYCLAVQNFAQQGTEKSHGIRQHMRLRQPDHSFMDNSYGEPPFAIPVPFPPMIVLQTASD